jgi:hypothetical protein
VLCLSACTHQISLKVQETTPGCPLTVTDSRPDPEALYMRATEWTARALLRPSPAETLRRHACQHLPNAVQAVPLRFTITDLDCTVTGFFEQRYVADLRGRLETLQNGPIDLRVGEVQVAYQGHVPTGCESALVPLFGKMAAEIAHTSQRQSGGAR